MTNFKKLIAEAKKGCGKEYENEIIQLDGVCGLRTERGDREICPECWERISTLKQCRKMVSKAIDEREPYPEDIFPPLNLSEFQTHTINDFLTSNLRFPLDRLSAEMMRRSRNNFKAELKETLGI